MYILVFKKRKMFNNLNKIIFLILSDLISSKIIKNLTDIKIYSSIKIHQFLVLFISTNLDNS